MLLNAAELLPNALGAVSGVDLGTMDKGRDVVVAVAGPATAVGSITAVDHAEAAGPTAAVDPAAGEGPEAAAIPVAVAGPAAAAGPAVVVGAMDFLPRRGMAPVAMRQH